MEARLNRHDHLTKHSATEIANMAVSSIAARSLLALSPQKTAATQATTETTLTLETSVWKPGLTQPQTQQ